MAQTVDSETGDVVLVTGGSGCLGQHVTYLLLTRCDGIAEVVTADTQPFTWATGMTPPPTVTTNLRHVLCDLTRYEEVDRICRSQRFDVVFNTAGYVDIGTAQDKKKMFAVNVKAVENIIRACIVNNIGYLVHTSSQDVAVGFEPIRNVDDATAKVPEKFLYYYAKSKHEGERAALDANSAALRSGGSLKTIALRPCPMYGEGDRHCITSGIRSAAHSRNGVLPRCGDPSALFQEAYAGNVAWGHILAMRKLKETAKPLPADAAATSPNPVDGKAFFLMDDTPVQNMFDFSKPYLEACGHKLSDYVIPYWLMFTLALVLEVVAFLLKPIKRIDIQLSRAALYYMRYDHYFNYSGAKMHLDYRPIYSPEEAQSRSMVFYRSLKFD